MAGETIHVSLADFARDLDGFFTRIVQDRETVVVENEAGERVEVRPARNGRHRSRKRRTGEEDFAALRAAAGSWADVDDEELLRKIYESRDLPLVLRWSYDVPDSDGQCSALQPGAGPGAVAAAVS